MGYFIIFFTKNIGEPYEREGENVVFDENIGGCPKSRSLGLTAFAIASGVEHCSKMFPVPL
jgi:hypothetical protein